MYARAVHAWLRACACAYAYVCGAGKGFKRRCSKLDELKVSVEEQRKGSLSRFVSPDVLRAFPCTSRLCGACESYPSLPSLKELVPAYPPASCRFHWSGWKGNDGTEHLALNKILINEYHLYPAYVLRPTPESRGFQDRKPSTLSLAQTAPFEAEPTGKQHRPDTCLRECDFKRTWK